jgi:hypothetical protein
MGRWGTAGGQKEEIYTSRVRKIFGLLHERERVLHTVTTK